ncbi:MAG: ribonuclease E inhibitor RraB [Geobacteraceae bacterium]
MKLLIIAIICIAAITTLYFTMKPSASTRAQESSRREMNARAFSGMRSETKWNLEGDMLWGFFFTNPTKPALEPVAKQLEKMGYRIVDIYLDDKKENWWLHVEKIETHNVDSLTRREEELSEIALKSNPGSYDGWDVGPVLK